MQRLFNVRQAPLDFGDDLDEVIYIETSACGTCNDGDAARAQAERLHYLPSDPNFFLRFSRERNSNRIADAFVQKDTESDRGFNCAYKRRSCFSHAQMKWIIDFLSEQTIGGNCAMHVGRFQRDDDVGEVEVLENLNMAQSRFDHRLRGCRAVLLQQIFFERAAVDADTNWHLLRLRGADNFDDALVLADVAGVQA